MNLHDLEQRVLQSHPSIIQAQAKVGEAQGRALQSGLYPNPFLAYDGRHLGANDTAGVQGTFLQQPIITGGKLRANRSLFEIDVEITRWFLVQEHYFLINTLRQHYNEVIAYQGLLGLYDEFEELAVDLVRLAQMNEDAENYSEIDVLLARRALRQLNRDRANLAVRYRESWRELAALIGAPGLPPIWLEGTREQDQPQRDFQAVREHLFRHSPELKVAELRIQREKYSLDRELRERYPNLALRVGNAFDYRRDQFVPFVRLYVELMPFDRNQGNILTARNNQINVRQDLERIKVVLHQRLARTFARYELALVTLDAYRTEAAESRRLLALALAQYREEQGVSIAGVESALSDYLTALGRSEQSLLELRQAEVALDGLLLTTEPVALGEILPPRGGLRQPLSPPAGNLPMRTIYP